jgi:CRP-like cAMP-binding protein
MRHSNDPFDDEAGSRTKIFHKGSLLVREGQSSDGAYIIKQGRVAVFRVRQNKRIGLGERGPGDMVGELALLTDEPHTASVEALEYTEALVLDRNLLRTLLVRSPRPVQIITGYLVERARTLSACITERPTGTPFLSVCRVVALAWRAGVASGQAELSYAELSSTIKDILLISQLEIDAIFEQLQKLHLVHLTSVKGTFTRTDPLLGEPRTGTAFVKDRLVRLPDADKFLQVAKNVAREYRDREDFGVDLEFCDLADFAREAQSTPDIIYKKIGYREIPEELFFFHKAAAKAYIERMGREFFAQASRPRLTAADLARVDDLVAVDNASLQEVFSELGFHKVAVLVAMAGQAARDKIMKNLSRKIAAVVKEEAVSLADCDEAEAADVERELIDRLRVIKGISA